MKRAILRLPAGTRFELLSPEQQAAINSVFAQFTLPMPGTIPAEGYELVDGVTGDNFDPAVMPDLGMNWPIVGLWQWDGKGALVALEPFDSAAMLAHLPPIVTYDGEGEPVSSLPQHDPTPPHSWAGWPSIHDAVEGEVDGN